MSSTEHFFVAHDAGTDEAGKLADQLELAFTHFQHFFAASGFKLNQPESKLGWISFSDSDSYERYIFRTERMDLSRLSGYYSSRTNRVVMMKSDSANDSSSEADSIPAGAVGEIAAISNVDDPNQLVKVAHELAHQLAFNTGLQKRGVMYPLWVSEGLATQYETELSYCHTINLARNDRLLEIASAGRLIRLDEFVCLTRLPAGRGQCEDLYAQAWGFFDFLLKYHPDKLKKYLETLNFVKKGYRSEAIINQEFSDCFGPVDLLNTQWLQYLRDIS
ncbi:MAG: DUF1570 domain-containing protein [Planctomycetota bacterium]